MTRRSSFLAVGLLGAALMWAAPEATVTLEITGMT
jgi:hypothetical protein